MPAVDEACHTRVFLSSDASYPASRQLHSRSWCSSATASLMLFAPLIALYDEICGAGERYVASAFPVP